jgi:hypothetical protein
VRYALYTLIDAGDTSAKYGPGARDDRLVKPSVLLVKMITEAFELAETSDELDDAPLMNNAAV